MAANTRKRRKTASSKGNDKEATSVTLMGQTGKQSSNEMDATFAGLPFDILLEIAARCFPLDILHLALVNQSLRGMLMSKSSACAWNAARSNLQGLPPPFDGMSEPAWVHLVFVKICHFCWKKAVVNPDLILQCRICPGCAKIHLIDMRIVLSTRPRDDRDMLQELFLSIVPTRTITSPGGKREHYQAIKKDLMEIDQLVLANSMSPEYLAERQGRMLRLRQHIALCDEWRVACHDQREKDFAELKSRRRQAIWDRLVAMGYKEDLEAMEDLSMTIYFDILPAMKGTATLTDRGWNKVRVDVVRFAEKVREARELKRHLRIVSQRKLYASIALRAWKACQPMPLVKYLPTIADFCEFPDVKSILERGDRRIFNFDMRRMDKLSLRWRVQLYRRMCKVAGKEILTGPGTGQEAFAFLHLARNVFICTDSCSVNRRADHRRRKSPPIGPPLWFPEYLTHKCCASGLVIGERDDVLDPAFRLDGLESAGRYYFGRVPWRGDKVLKKEEVMEGIVKKVIGLAGLDAETATVADMDATLTLFECRTCSVVVEREVGEGIADDTPDRELMHWRVCVAHIFEHHYVGHEDLENIIQVNEDGSTPDGFYAVESPNLNFLYECVRCRDTSADTPGGRDRHQVVNHCLQVHNIAHPTENVDFGELPGTRPEGRRWDKVLLFSRERKSEMMTAKRHIELNGKLL